MTHRQYPHAAPHTGFMMRDLTAIPEGKVRCPSCLQPASLTASGRLRKHHDGAGDECYQRMFGKAQGITAPPVEMPAKRQPAPRQKEPESRPRVVTGHCHTCDRAISGERLFCGPCAAKRGNS